MNELVNANPIAIGAFVKIDSEAYQITRYVDLYSVIAIKMSSGAPTRLSITDILSSLDQSSEDVLETMESSGFENLPTDRWDTAQERAAKIAPLLGDITSSREMAKAIARDLDVHVATVYRWVRKIKENGRVADLAPYAPSGGRGKVRIDPLVDTIVNEAIEEKYLQSQRPHVTRLMRDIAVRCKRANLTPPHPNTVRRRIMRLSEKVVLKRRHGTKAADDKYTARPGSFPGADWPNAVWQIDHTPLDLVIVDDVHRRHIGRPWLTLAIDVYSRCVAGFYLSLDPPSEVSVGMCLVNAMLPKDGWIAALGVQTRWPVYGSPATVHADNGKEFHGSMISRAAEQHRFRMEWRKVKTPNWGGHIERLMGTFNDEVHALPGTTFSTIHKRGVYEPHTEATLTFSELELYLTEFISGVYHQKLHSAIGRSPIRRYEVGLLGDGVMPGRGLPCPIADPRRLRLDFMPLIERTVQPYGVRIDGLTYYDPVLDDWIRASDFATKRPRRFMIRRDPRDVSVVYFLNPGTNRYYPIPFRNLQHPSISLWELREVRVQLKREGLKEVDEEVIFETYERLNQLVEEAQRHKVTARKAAQKKRQRPRAKSMEQAQEGALPGPATCDNEAMDAWDAHGEVLPFSVIKVR